MNLHITALGIGFVLDLLFGDPGWMIHPVCLMGRTIAWAEKTVRKFAGNDKKKLLAGSWLLCAGNVIFWTGLSYLVCSILYRINPAAGLAGESFMCWQLLAVKGLKSESMKVYEALKHGTIDEARYAVSMIVGRDTKSLDEKGVTKAAVETVAENLSDGVIAPLLFMAVLGAPLGYFYKVVNTMDSMVGYKDEKYLYIGRIPAKLDDILNYIPARISALLMIAAAPAAGLNARDAFIMWRRDGRNHASPNSAQTEAAAAGALGVQLAGDAYYFGKLYKKPTIGDKKREIEIEDIKRINRLLYITATAAMAIVLAAGI